MTEMKKISKKTLKERLDGFHWYCILYRHEKPIYIDVIKSIDIDALYEGMYKYDSIRNYTEFYRWVRLVFRMDYHFKCECEMNISDLFNEGSIVKIDVYHQLEPNIKLITELLNNRLELGFDSSTLVEKDESTTIKVES